MSAYIDIQSLAAKAKAAAEAAKWLEKHGPHVGADVAPDALKICVRLHFCGALPGADKAAAYLEAAINEMIVECSRRALELAEMHIEDSRQRMKELLR